MMEKQLLSDTNAVVLRCYLPDACYTDWILRLTADKNDMHKRIVQQEAKGRKPPSRGPISSALEFGPVDAVWILGSDR
jgi:hypothetical protein